MRWPDLDDTIEDARTAQILSGAMHDRLTFRRNAGGGAGTGGGKLFFERHGFSSQVLVHLL